MPRPALPRRPATRAGRTWRRAAGVVRRRVAPSDGLVLLVVVLLALLLGVLALRYRMWVPLSSLTLVLYLGGYLLTRRSLVLLFLAVIGIVAVVTYAGGREDVEPVEPGVLLVLAATAVLVFVVARSRLRLGLPGTRGESMFVDLRDRLKAQGTLPALPPGWGAEVALRSAYGASFSGDFVVAFRSPDGRLLEVALIDVSGKGADAGTRALLLSGAFGGLLGAMPPEDFLPAANRYLLRQNWPEGFATAVHLALDLDTGDFCVTSAGHPPAAQFVAGSGRWRVIDATTGPLLGIIEDSTYEGESGSLGSGDALLLYTDGVIEVPGRDLSVGIDRLLGEAERLVPRGFHNGARALLDAVASGDTDDRAILLLWRA
jgi:Stage II sporulation protein E (SpoIIE)